MVQTDMALWLNPERVMHARELFHELDSGTPVIARQGHEDGHERTASALHHTRSHRKKHPFRHRAHHSVLQH